jgi:hypothetical protein
MVRIRRIGLFVAGTTLVAAIVASLATEGLWLALLVGLAAVIAAALVIPAIAVFEEERDLPYAREARRQRY